MKVGIDATKRADELKIMMGREFQDTVVANLDRITQESKDVRTALTSYATECLAQMFNYSAALAANLIMENNEAIEQQLQAAGLQIDLDKSAKNGQIKQTVAAL